jgi:phenylacetate-CoA ligase
MPPFWRYSAFSKNLLMSSYHLSGGNMPAYIAKLKEFEPDYIDAYPSSIFAIAHYALANGISLRGVTKGITTSAETLFPEQRDTIEKAFGTPVYDQYGCAEMAVFVGQCKEGRYHIHEDYGIVELLDDAGNPALPGQEAEIVCTGFINPIMPLIRYKIGDMAVLSAAPCPCGSPFQALDAIIGRMDDVIVTPDGRKIGRLSPVLKGFPVQEAQYIQESNDTLRVLLVKGAGFTDADAKNICQELQKRLGPLMQVKLEYTLEIPRGARGKYRNIVSLKTAGLLHEKMA